MLITKLDDERLDHVHTKATGLPILYLTSLRASLEREEAVMEKSRMQLVAISVVALANTLESAKGARLSRDHEYWTPSHDDVCAAVDREMALRAERDVTNARFTVPIVCICGSTRFKQAWIAENARLTGEGNIVLAVGLWGHHERVFPDAETKKKLDELHLRKIDLCDWVWVLDIGGYIGESTRSEIAYAEAHGKPVCYLSKEIPDYVEPVDAANAILARIEVEGMAEIMYEAHGIHKWNIEILHTSTVNYWREKARALRDYLKGGK
ncbi:MAG: hypothetical protein WCV62_05965 [Candidatus Peribacteraceae bacterium]|jgi:hypothetical protein